MKIFRCIRERKRLKALKQFRRSLIREVQEISKKLEVFENLLSDFARDSVLTDDLVLSLLLECQLHYTQQQQEKYRYGQIHIEYDFEIRNAQSIFDKGLKISTAIENLKSQKADAKDLAVLRELVFDYAQNLQQGVNGYLTQIFAIDQGTSDEAYLSYLETIDFKNLDIIDEIPDLVSDLDTFEEETDFATSTGDKSLKESIEAFL